MEFFVSDKFCLAKMPSGRKAGKVLGIEGKFGCDLSFGKQCWMLRWRLEERAEWKVKGEQAHGRFKDEVQHFRTGDSCSCPSHTFIWIYRSGR